MRHLFQSCVSSWTRSGCDLTPLIRVLKVRHLLIISLLFPLLLTTPAFPQTIIPGGPVSGTWNLAGSPYLVEGEITLEADHTLTIQPGVTVEFQGWYKFIVRGMLQAVGTESDSITFTAADTSQGWHGLRFYYLYTQPDSCRLVYCKLEYGRSASDNGAGDDKHGGIVYVINSDNLLIGDCLICSNRTGNVHGQRGINGGISQPGGPGGSAASGHGGAIYLVDSNPVITGNEICRNRTGDATGGRGGEAGDTYSTTWYTHGQTGGSGGTGTSGSGGALYCLRSSPVVNNNLIHHNRCGIGRGGQGGRGGDNEYTGYGGYPTGGNGGSGGNGQGGHGGALKLDLSSPLMVNNMLYANGSGEGTGGRGGNGGHAYDMCPEVEYGGDGGDGGNGYGGKGACLYCANYNPVIQNVTVSANISGMGNGGFGGSPGLGYWYNPGDPGDPGMGIDGEGLLYAPPAATVQMTNSIVWANGTSEISGGLDISFSCIQGGYPGWSNIDRDPCFVNNPVGDSFLSQWAAGQAIQSPCVDAGNPVSPLITGTTRTDGIPDEYVIDMGFHYTNTFNEPVLSVMQDSLCFMAVLDGPNPPPQLLVVSNPSIGEFNFTVSCEVGWININPVQGGPVPPQDTIEVTVDIVNLPAGLHETNIIVTANGAWASPDTIEVALFIANHPIISVTPDSLYFTATTASGNPPVQSFLISNIGYGTINYTIAENISWLSVEPDSGGPLPPDETILVELNLTELMPGNYVEEIMVFSDLSPDIVDTVTIILDYSFTNPIRGYTSGELPADRYDVIGTVYVLQGDSLTICAGSSFFFYGPYEFSVGGYISAQGNEDNPIIFTSSDAIESWAGFYFYDYTLDTSHLEYCHISKSSSSGLYILESSPRFSNCIVSNNESLTWAAGVRIVQGSPSFSYCTIENNTTRGSDGLGGGIWVNSGNPIFDHCVIRGNSIEADDAKGGGIGLGWDGHITLLNCTISDNTIMGSVTQLGSGVYNSGWGDIDITNCLIEGNSDDGIFLITGSGFIIEYCNIANHPGGNFGGSVPPNLGLLSQTNANGDSCDVYYNIFLDPLFVDPDSGDYHLLEGSPCIDAGDPASVWDPDSTLADIGAFYFHQQTGGLWGNPNRLIPKDFCLFPAYPNPFNPATTIRFGLPAAAQVKIAVYDIRGRRVAKLTDGWRQAGYHDVTFDAEHLASGVYFYRINATDFSATGKLLLLK